MARPGPDLWKAEPVFEARLAKLGVIAGHECALAQLCTEVSRVWVCDHLARIVAFAESLPDEFVETKLFWPRHFNGAVQRRPVATLPTALATSSAAIGWMRTGASRTVLPTVASSAILLMNSKNCVAWTIE